MSELKYFVNEYGEIIRTNVKKSEKSSYQISDNIQPELFFDEKEKCYKVKCGTAVYPLFDEEKGLSHFMNSKGEEVYYDSRIPVKDGEEPILSKINGKYMLKFGPDHKLLMPYESRNGEIYSQMKHEYGGTINIPFPSEKAINLAQMKAKLKGNSL